MCTYDANGNVKSDGNANYFWNEFSKLASSATSGTPTCGSSGRCLTYDAFGRIVEQSNSSTWTTRWITQLGETVYMNGATPSYAYWSGPGGGRVLIYGNSSNYDYLHTDWLGNARIDSDPVGHTIATDQAYTPYGEIYDIFGSNVAQNKAFAGLTGDFFPGTTMPLMWDTPNRELSMVSRWLSPDPAGASWNAYSYPTNPNIGTDPSGAMQRGPGDCNCSGNASGFQLDDFTGDSTTTYAVEYGAGATHSSSNDHMASTSVATDNGTANGQNPADSAQKTYTIQVVGDDGKTRDVKLPVGSQVLVMSRSDTIAENGAKEADVTYKVNNVTTGGLEVETKPTEIRMTESITAGSNCSSGCTNKSYEPYYKAAQFVDANHVGGYGDRTTQTTQHYVIGDSKSPATLLREIPGTGGRYDMGTAVRVTSTRTSVVVKLEP